MKIGYPCINNSLNCTSNRTFRLSNYSETNLVEKIQQNLLCLQKTLEFNIKNNILFFRIGSGLIPFASHEVNSFNWLKNFQKDFELIGKHIKKHDIRISMHPDQFVVLNSNNSEIVKRSVEEIKYHSQLLDAMKLKQDAKVQIHVGGVYNNKKKSIKRFIENYRKLETGIKKRLVIENDHISYSLIDCLFINKKIKIPIIFDAFHHQCLSNGEKLYQAMEEVKKTWKEKDGIPMVDYSSQKNEKRKGVHIDSVNINSFMSFLKQIKEINCDIMLEIKDKEKSALKIITRIKRGKGFRNLL